MKKQEANTTGKAMKVTSGKDNTSRVLLIAAVVLYSASLILLANLALAVPATKIGALIKVNNKLDGNSFAMLNADVKSIAGNVLAIDIPQSSLVRLPSVKGLCANHIDKTRTNSTTVDSESQKQKYAGAGVVVGILDNMGVLSAASLSKMKKIEKESNVGFISYVSNTPGSTVIMRNLKNGESNLIQALLYMQEYAKTVERPLIIEMAVGSEEMNNPLFVQVCQKFADAGVQFLGTDITVGAIASQAPLQLAFTMFDAQTGEIRDQSDFWAIEEVKDQRIMLLGTDDNTCMVHFVNESGFDKIFMSNNSNDIVMVTALSGDGNVNYYHIKNKESALIPRNLANGTPMLEDGLGGIYPYHSKGVLFNGAVSDKQYVALGKANRQVALESGMEMSVGSPNSKTLAMSLNKLSAQLSIEIKDESGTTVYRNQPDEQTQSIKTRIDLSSGVGGLYFLDLTSPEFHQTFALQID